MLLSRAAFSALIIVAIAYSAARNLQDAATPPPSAAAAPGSMQSALNLTSDAYVDATTKPPVPVAPTAPVYTNGNAPAPTSSNPAVTSTATNAYKDGNANPASQGGVSNNDPLLLSYTEIQAAKAKRGDPSAALGHVYGEQDIPKKSTYMVAKGKAGALNSAYDSTLQTSSGSLAQSDIDLCGWVTITKNANLLPSFLFNIKGEGQEMVEGDRYIAFAGYRPDLKSPTYLVNPIEDAAVSNVTDAEKLSPNGYFVLEFVRAGEVFIVQNKAYWAADLNARLIRAVKTREDATTFQIITYPNYGLLVIRAGDMFVQLARNTFGSPITLGSTIDPFTLFHPWNALQQNSSIRQALKVTNELLLRTRQRQLIADPPRICPIWIAYDMALAIPTDIKFDTLQLPKSQPGDIVNALSTSITLIHRTILVQRYGQLYQSFGKGFSDDFKFHKIVRSSVLITPVAWMEFYRLLDSLLKESLSSKEIETDRAQLYKSNMLAMVLSETVTRDVSMFGTESYFAEVDLNMEFARYFNASICLAWDIGWQKNLDLASTARMTQIPWMKNSWKVYTRVSNTSIDYWFTPFLTPKIVELKITRDHIFPELCLLLHLDQTWQRSHSNVGDGIVDFVISIIEDASKDLDAKRLLEIFTNSQVLQITILAESFCEKEITTIICYLMQVSTYTILLQSLAVPNSEKTPVRDLSITNDNDAIQSSQLLSQSQKLMKMIDTITRTKNDMLVMVNEMSGLLLDQISDAFLANLAKTGDQMRQEVLASYAQSRTQAIFEMNLGKSALKQATALADARFKASNDVREEYLTTLNKLVRSAFKEVEFNLIFSSVTTSLSVMDGVQSFVNPKSQTMGGGGAMNVANEAVQLGVAISALQALKNLQKGLEKAITELAALAKRIVDQVPRLASLMKLAGPIMEAVLNDDEVLSDLTEVYYNESKKIGRLNLTSTVSMMDTTFDTLTSSICQHMSRPGFPPCVSIQGLNSKFFGNLREAAEAFDDVMFAIGAIVGGAGGADIAKGTLLVMNATLEDFNSRYEQISKMTTNTKLDRLENLQQMKRNQWILITTTTVTNMIFKISMILQIYQLCLAIGYTNAGMVPPTCLEKVLNFQSVTGEDLNDLLAFELASKPRIDEFLVTIPTQPSHPKDTSFLDLKQVMSGKSHIFRLPMDEKWLKRHNWVNDVDDLLGASIYIEKFTIILPPSFVDGNEEVAITITAKGIQDLGPAAPPVMRYYTLPDRSLQISYTTGQCQGEAEDSPYAQCGAKLNQLCFERSGLAKTREGGNRIALFSDFQVSAKIVSLTAEETGQPAAAYRYSGLSSPLLLRAKVITATLRPPRNDALTPQPMDTNQTGTSFSETTPTTRSLSRTVGFNAISSQNKRSCCPQGEYTLDHTQDNPRCFPCPRNSDSYLGGMFCLAKSRTAS